MIYFPIIGALADASSTIMQRLILRVRKIDIKSFQVSVFFAVVLLFLPFIYFVWGVEPEAWQFWNIFVFILVIILSVISNLVLFYSIKGEKIGNLEPAIVLQPLFVIILAIIFSAFRADLFERDLTVIIPALIAGTALVLSHIKRHHLNFNKYFIAAIAASFLFALELVVSKFILDYYTPFTFYFLRCVVVLAISWLLFRPTFSGINNKIKLEILFTAALWIVFRVVVYYGYDLLGVIFTTLMLMLSPVFVYVFARIFLKEKLNWENIVTAAVIVACVLYVAVF